MARKSRGGLYVIHCNKCGWHVERRKGIEKVKRLHASQCEGAEFTVKAYLFTVPPPAPTAEKRSRFISLHEHRHGSSTRKKRPSAGANLPEVYPAEN
jgi:hypothetical protein